MRLTHGSREERPAHPDGAILACVDPSQTWLALLATGCTEVDGAATLWASGIEALREFAIARMVQAIRGAAVQDEHALSDLLRELFKGEPDLGNAAFRVCGRLCVQADLDLEDCTDLETLPVGLNVMGDLNLAGCTGITELPSDLGVGGNLNLHECVSLAHLPKGLKADWIILTMCFGWDGIIPEDADIRGKISTDFCGDPNALTLKEWRERFGSCTEDGQ